MAESKLNRRTILRGLGVSLALPILQRDADAAFKLGEKRTPMRMVCVANPLGFVPENFFPAESGQLRQLPRLMQPFAKQREQISLFSHLDHGVSGGHQAVHSFLSGIRTNESAQWASRNQSIDQRAAELVQGETRFSSLVASVGANSGELECRTSWTRNGVNVPPVTSPVGLFNDLFLSENQHQRAQKKASFRRHASILDAVMEQAKSLDKELGRIDRRKMEEYLTSVRSVESRLITSEQWLYKPKPKIELQPPLPNQAFTKRLPLFYDLIRLALQTDSTRVAALSIPGNLPVNDLGLQGNYHAFSHHGKSDRLLEPLFKIELFQMLQLARFLKSLSDAKQPDGKSLLDKTIVLAGSGMGNASSHSNKDLPILLAGGGFRHGSHHAMPTESHRRIPLANLFTTMLNRFSDMELGKFNRATGDLDEVLA